jgi:aminocarboxymuconate-semialdehyde decarboxylase
MHLPEENDFMRSIDIHAHVVPRSLWNAIDAKAAWYGFRHEPGEGLGSVVGGGKRTTLPTPKVRYTPEERLKDMDAQGTDVQVLSIHTPFFGYHLDAAEGRALGREVNEEIAGMTRQWPARFSGLATLPVQDVKSAIDELEYAVTRLGLKGAELDTNVNGEQWDEAKYLPFFKAAEQMGAVLFFHPQPQNNFLAQRVPRHGLSNSLGVILDDAIVAAVLICGGVLEACPDLRVCIAHGGGPTCYAMGRLDRGWDRLPQDKRTPHPPSAYQKRLYYDTVVGSEEALRFLLDRVGADRIVLGSDWPFVGWNPGPGPWVQGLKSLTQDEKDRILWKNLESLLKL